MDLSKNILKQGVGKGKSCLYGEMGFEGVTTTAPPPKKNGIPNGIPNGILMGIPNGILMGFSRVSDIFMKISNGISMEFSRVSDILMKFSNGILMEFIENSIKILFENFIKMSLTHQNSRYWNKILSYSIKIALKCH